MHTYTHIHTQSYFNRSGFPLISLVASSSKSTVFLIA